MLIIGLILLIVGIVTGLGLLATIGVIILLVGAVFMVVGVAGRPVRGRRYWY